MSLIDSINKHFETRSEIYNVLSEKNVTLPVEGQRYLSCVPDLINSISGWTGPGDPQYHCQLKIKIKYNENLSESEVNDIKNLINSNDTENNTLLEIKLNNNNDIYQFKLVTLDPESDNNVYFITTPTTTDCKIGILLPAVNNIKYGASPVIHNISPENNYTIELMINKLQAEAVFYERIQIKENVGSAISYLRKRTYDSNGTEKIDFGYFTNKDNSQVWVDQSGIRMSIATVNANNSISKSYIDSKAGEIYNNYIDLHDVLKEDFGMKHVKVIVKTKYQDIDNDFIQLKKFYTRIYTESINFITKNSNTEQESSEPKICIVTSITPGSTPPELLTDYHIHSAFQKFIRQDTGSIDIKDGDYAYLPCYRASISSVQDENDNELNIIVSKPGTKASLTDGKYNTPQYRENDLELCKNNNRFDVTISSDNEIINLYKNNDERRFTSYTTYENDLQNLINYICFGIDPTEYFKSRSQKSYILGETSVLLNNGYYFGKFEAGGKPILQCGVEDSNWASNGCIIFNALYQTSVTDPNSSKTTNNWLVALDRKDIKVNSINNQLLLQNGYDILNYPIKSGIQNTRQGFDNRAGYIDFYFPTTDMNMDNITVGNQDAFLVKSVNQENTWLQILLDSPNHKTFTNTDGVSDRGNYYGQLFTLNTYLNNSESFSDNLSNYSNDEEINFALITKLLSINNNEPVYASLYKYNDGPYFSFTSSFTLSNRIIYECDNLISTSETLSPLQVNINYSSGNHGVSIKSVELIDMETYTKLSDDNLSGFIGSAGHSANNNYSRTFNLQNDINKYKNKNIVVRANLWIDTDNGSTNGNITINNYNVIQKTYSFDANKFVHVANSNNSIYHNVDQYAFFKFNNVSKDLLNSGTYLLVFKNSIENDNLFSNIIQSRFNILKANSSSNKIIGINSQAITINNNLKPDLMLYMDNNNLPINSPDITIHYPVVNSDSNYTGVGSGPWCKDCDDTLLEPDNNLTSVIKNGYIVEWWSALLSFNPIQP